MMFDIYINDIFKGMPVLSVPGIRGRLSGLLFADIAVILIESADKLQKLFNILTGWCKCWDINFNSKKYGIVAINCLDNATFKIPNQLIPSMKTVTETSLFGNSNTSKMWEISSDDQSQTRIKSDWSK
ncbi:hypothetical protein BB561_003816 [Smittium simulii]|uniref:Reverse transcriptase domain-containing protein n=1 Tax=Smittium simulii TaxID=133385 RepID=A0A2T9YJF5_9FUNG|nr:hypothetical protein BB561_003816 [Smittium simulii]